MKYFIYFFILLSFKLFSDITSTTGNIQFDVNSDSQSEMILDSTGLGIGTSSPSANLHVQGNAIISGSLYIGQSSGNSTLEVTGSLGYSVESVSSNVTLSGNSVVLVNTNNSGNITINLPPASSVTGRRYTIKKINSGNVVNVISTLDGGIDNKSGYALSSGNIFPFIELISNGSQWYILKNSSEGTSAGTTGSGNLLAYWKLDETTGTSASNSSSSNNTGTLINGFTFSGNSASGNIGTALDFDGANDYVDAGVLTGLENATQGTITAWLYRASSSDIVSVGDPASLLYRFGISWYGLDGRYYLVCANGQNSHGFVTYTGTGWHHFAMVYDGSQTGNANRMLGYIDGVLQSLSFTNTIPANLPSSGDQGSCYLGRDINDQYSKGRIDDVRIYNRALSASEIQTLYQLGQ